MWIALDENSDLPLHKQIYNQIKMLILHGELKAEERLPSSRTLSKELEVARNTVLEAYDQLLAEGYLEARHGSGTTVARGISASRPQSIPQIFTSTLSTQESTQKEVINFRSGIPALEVFPQKEWGKLYQQVCASLPSLSFRYGTPDGVWELRKAIREYLFRVRGIRTNPEQIMITSGSTQGLWVVSRLLHRKNAMTLVEDPAHKGLVEVITRAGYAVKGIRVDEYGMDTNILSTLCPKKRNSIAFTYVTPSHQYPLGGILPMQRRQALIHFAQSTGSYIVEDDYDSEFRYEGAPISSLYELAPNTVIYLGSFSKILAPALRLGFAIIPESMLEKWHSEKLYTDVHTDALSQYALAEFINSGGLERHIWKMKKLYKRKRAYLLRCLSQNFGKLFTVSAQSAGLHLVVGFSGVTFTEKILTDLYERGIKIFPVAFYSLCHDGAHNHEIILGYSHLCEEEIKRGVMILREVLAKI